MRKYRQLTSGERYALSALRRQGHTQAEIARTLGRHPSTISREVRRNSKDRTGRVYRPALADDYARWRWSITPKLRGRRRLQLIVAARTIGPDGLAAETALPDQIIEIKVSANYGVLARRAAGWTIAAVMGGLLAQFGAQIWTALEPFIEPLMRQ